MDALITAMAQISSLGSDLDSFRTRAENGESGVRTLPADFTREENFPVRFAHLIDESIALPERGQNLFLEENRIVARHLLKNVAAPLAGKSVDALLWGNSQAGIKFADIRDKENSQTVTARRWRKVLCELAAQMDLNIPESSFIGMACNCTTALTALGVAAHKINTGRWQRAIVLVQELRCRDWVLWPYYKMGLLSPHAAMQPFSVNRRGFVKGEGGAAFLLESEKAMSQRQGSPYCRVRGVATYADGAKILEPAENLERAKAAVSAAMGGVAPGQIDCIQAYGSGSLKCDRMESRLIKEVFGPRGDEIPITALKPQVGHLNTAAAGIEAIGLALMIHRQRVWPTLGLSPPDPLCNLRFVEGGTAQPAKIEHALQLGFGFGWSNAAALFSRH